jgi:ribonuclease HII
LRLRVVPDLVLVDGNQVPEMSCPCTAVVCGDRDVPAIGAASIVAKVVRDRLMTRLAARHPAYGWQHNVGYPTRGHREALLHFGVSPHHRRSFAPVRARLMDQVATAGPLGTIGES